jgi:hypothetical protein
MFVISGIAENAAYVPLSFRCNDSFSSHEETLGVEEVN